MAELYDAAHLKIKNPRIVDLGCNVGYESLKLYNKLNPSFLISVDPFEENIKRTKTLIPKIRIGDKERDSFIWQTDCCAIANEDGEALMSYTISEHTNNSPCGGIIVGEPRNIVLKQTVKTKRLDSICASPDILKVDIEGYEWFVWDQFIKTESIKIIFLELHGTDTLPIEHQFAKIEELKHSFNLRWFKYAQAQKLEPDDCEETDESVFQGVGSFCHVLCERK